jgi:hypothetical protein
MKNIHQIINSGESLKHALDQNIEFENMLDVLFL